MIPRVAPGERSRCAVLALLLFANAVVMESNEVVATSGFVSQIGADAILWVWAADMLIVILSSGAYSLVVDRMRRDRLAVRLLLGFGLLYVGLFALFWMQVPGWATYSALAILTDQHWLLLPMVIWALANDVFSTAEAKRLFPMLGGAAFAGGVFGNGLTAAVALWFGSGQRGSLGLLLSNAGLLLVMSILLAGAIRRQHSISEAARQSREGEKLLDTLREGLGFVREVPAYRYLALAMVLLGAALNVVEYQMIATAARAYSEVSQLEGFYATVRAARILLMVLVQGLVAVWLLDRLGFKSIFWIMPAALLAGLSVAFFWPVLVGVVIGEYAARITLEGIDEPSRRAFLGLVPDERRGRVSAFMDGYLYPLGSLLSCGFVGAVLFAVGHGLLTRDEGRAVYFAIAGLCIGVALWAVGRFRAHFDESMLNWRLKRRRRGTVLSRLEL